MESLMHDRLISFISKHEIWFEHRDSINMTSITLVDKIFEVLDNRDYMIMLLVFFLIFQNLSK